jgi:alanine dehydrogenase
MGNIERNNRHISQGGPGSIALCVGRNLSPYPEKMKPWFHQADILVDASYRRDPTRPVVPNNWVEWLPEHAVIVDLAVDPYLLDHNPPTVRGVEGIPQGNLDKYVFSPTDPDWDKTVPQQIPSRHRRTVVSCYSWPGIHPTACMEHYARQLEPLMEVLLTRPFEAITLEGNYFERALARAKIPEY